MANTNAVPRGEEYTRRLEHVRKAMPDETLLNRVSDFLKACGDPTRVGIICALIGTQMCVSDIAETLNMTSSAISHQLRLLKHMGIVESHRTGKSVFYSLSDPHIAQIFKTAFEHVMEGA